MDLTKARGRLDARPPRRLGADLLAIWPAELRSIIDDHDTTAEALAAMAPGRPVPAGDSVAELAVSLADAAKAGESFDLTDEAARIVATHDAHEVAALTHALAVQALERELRSAVRSVLPDAHRIWTARVQELTDEYAEALGDWDDVPEEIDALRAGGEVRERWEQVQALRAEFARLQRGFIAARRLAHPGDRSYAELYAIYPEPPQKLRFRPIVPMPGHSPETRSPLDVAVAYDCDLWFPTREQQAEQEERFTAQLRAERPQITPGVFAS